MRDRETGVLVRSALADDELVAAYVAAVDWLYEREDRIATMGAAAFAQVRDRHGSRAYEDNVARIFGLHAASNVPEAVSHAG